MSLLAHRGGRRGRNRSGFLQQFTVALRAVMPRLHDRPGGRIRAGSLSGMVLAVAVFGCFGFGYLLGNVFPWSARGGLRAEGPEGGRTGTPPRMIGEAEDTRPLAGTCLLTAVYPDLALAQAAARQLRQQGLNNARPYEWVTPGKPAQWCLVVYYDGTRERDSLVAALRTTVAPDATFESYRKTQKDWPLERQVQ